MTVYTKSGYSWTDGKFARILHGGNRFSIKTITASDEVAAYPASRVDNGLTVEKWRPFSNLALSPTDFSDTTVWTATNLSVDSGGTLLTETAASGEHDLSAAYTFASANEHVLAFKVERQTVPEIQVRANDGTTSFTCFFDLRDASVGTAANATGQIIEQEKNVYLCSIRFTPAAATGVVELLLSNGSETVSYAGSTSNTLIAQAAYLHESSATLRLDTFTAQSGDCFAVGVHNLGSGGARIKFQHDSNENDKWTTIGTESPGNNSPIMFFFDSVSSPRWRLTIDRGVMPEIGIVWIGAALKMERPFYVGFSPSRMARETEIIGNMSRTGQLLGRSIKRTMGVAEYSWNNLTYSWVRANLDGTKGLIQSSEVDPMFAAWRPSETNDVDFLMRVDPGVPQATGPRDLWSFEMSGEVYGYE